MNTNPEPQPKPEPPASQPEPRPPFNEVSVLFPLLTLVTVAYLAMLIAEFFLPGAVRVPGIMMPVYVSLLGAYAADKEIRRWVGAPEPARKGVIFVYLWVLAFTVLVIVSFFRASDYPMPQELGKVVLQVLGVFFGSRASKYICERRSEAALDPAEVSGRQARILEVIRTKGEVTRAEVSEMLGMSKSAANKLLETMLQQSLVRKIGEGRGTHYIDGK